MLTRRELFPLAASCAAAVATRALVRAEGSPLPLHTTGLEHIGFTVPEPEVSAKFYGRIFDPQLFQEREAPPRFYARVGTAYTSPSAAMPASPQRSTTSARWSRIISLPRCALHLPPQTSPWGRRLWPCRPTATVSGCSFWEFPEAWPRVSFPIRESARTPPRLRPLGWTTLCSR